MNVLALARSTSDLPLYQLAYTGQVSQARRLLAAGADPNANDPSALMVASERGHREMVQLLIKHGAELDARDTEFGFTALHLACGHNQPECAEVLIKAGCSTTAVSHDGMTWETMAARAGYPGLVTRLKVVIKARQFGLLSVADKFGLLKEQEKLKCRGTWDPLVPCQSTTDVEVIQSYLFKAVLDGNRPLVQRLLDEHGSDPSEPSMVSNGLTPLMMAATEGHAAILQLLWDRVSALTFDVDAFRCVSTTVSIA